MVTIDNISIAGKDPPMKQTFELILKRYSESLYFRALRFSHRGTHVIYRYPFEYDENEYFLQKLSLFIANDLERNDYINLNSNSNSYHVDFVNDKVEFIDKSSFNEREREYKKQYISKLEMEESEQFQ